MVCAKNLDAMTEVSVTCVRKVEHIAHSRALQEECNITHS